MRIIAGALGGRLFNSPHGHRTHPMSDKMRGALFNMLGDITGLSVLDAFAGSGALGFEAASRGAGSVLLLDRDRNAQRTISENITSLGLEDQVTMMRAHAKAWLNRNQQSYDIVLLDPPYDDLQHKLLEKLAQRVAPGGRLVLSWPGGDMHLQFPDLKLLISKQYGDGSLHIYQRGGDK